MNKTKQIIATVLVIITMMVSYAPAGGFQINEQNARAMGFAGAFVAQASDASAVYFNPAGLAFQKGRKVQGGTTFIIPSTTFTGPTPSTTKASMKSQVFYPSNLYLSYGMSDGLTFGLGIFTPYGLGSEWPADWAGRRLSVRTDLKSFYINPSVGYRIGENFSIGAGISYIIADVSLKFRVPTYSSLAPPTPSPRDGTASLEADGTGFGFNLGLMFKPTTDLSIGLSYRSLTDLEFSGEATFTDMQAMTTYFPGGPGKTKLPLSSCLAGGIAYHASERFTLEADIQYVGWAKYNELVVDLQEGPAFPLTGKPLQADMTSKKNWEDTFLIKIGGEYRLGRLALRLGYIFDTTPQPEKSVEPMLPDADRNELSVGLGYKLSDNLSLDAAYQLILFKDRIVSTGTNVFPGTYESTASLIGINIGYQF